MSDMPETGCKSDDNFDSNKAQVNENKSDNNTYAEVINSMNKSPDNVSHSSPTGSGQMVSNNSVKRKLRSLTFGRRRKSVNCSSHKCKNNCKNSGNNCNNTNTKDNINGKKKKSSSVWNFKLCARTDSCVDVNETVNSCVCTAYKKTDQHVSESDPAIDDNLSINNDNCDKDNGDNINHNTDQMANEQRSRVSSTPIASQDSNEIVFNSESYVENNLLPDAANVLNSGSAYGSTLSSQNIISEVRSVQVRVSELALALRSQLSLTVNPYPYLARWGEVAELTPGFLNRFCLRNDSSLTALNDGQQIHTQIDYIHCLVPDLLEITNCSFYWGKMDRYEAERLLENRPEGTFLLRDSAQEEHLFSVSFRRFDRSLHARIEQWNHKFSFDSHDPGVYSSNAVCGLIEHYKDPSHCMFFEPMLTIPLHRNFTFSLQHLSRAIITSRVSYDTIQSIELPKRLKNYLKEYHYKQQVRVRRLDTDH